MTERAYIVDLHFDRRAQLVLPDNLTMHEAKRIISLLVALAVDQNVEQAIVQTDATRIAAIDDLNI